MAPDTAASTDSIGARINALRDQWHTKNHPFFQELAKGRLELNAMGIYMAHHFKFVEYALPSFGLLYYRAPSDVRNALVENMSEEAGLKAIPVEGHVPHDHYEFILGFCAAAGLTEADVNGLVLPPVWLGRALHYVQCLREEPIGVALNNEATIPAFTSHYGFDHDAPEIGFFVEHAEADLEHSNRQISLCQKYLDTPALQARALEVAEMAVKLRWESITHLHRRFVLKEAELLPEGVGG